MKVQVFYDADGVVQSVMALERKARVTPTSPGLASIAVDLKTLKVDSLAEVHWRYHVDDRGRLRLRDDPKRPKAGKARRPDGGV